LIEPIASILRVEQLRNWSSRFRAV
jgi:hypothetical protein